MTSSKCHIKTVSLSSFDIVNVEFGSYNDKFFKVAIDFKLENSITKVVTLQEYGKHPSLDVSHILIFIAEFTKNMNELEKLECELCHIKNIKLIDKHKQQFDTIVQLKYVQ